MVNGEAYDMTPLALSSHQRVAVKIVKQLDESLDNYKNCHALIESEVKFRKYTIVRDDVFMKCGEIDGISIIFEVVRKGSVKREDF